MQNFEIIENVPTEQHHRERAVGHIAALGSRLAVKAGHSAVLAYAQVFDDFWKTEYKAELSDMFTTE